MKPEVLVPLHVLSTVVLKWAKEAALAQARGEDTAVYEACAADLRSVIAQYEPLPEFNDPTLQ